MGLWRWLLGGPRNDDRPLADTAVPPERIDALESRLVALEKTETQAIERELVWQEMNRQLRRYLGRLDAIAGHDRREEERQLPDNGGPSPEVMAALTAAKFGRKG